MPSPDATFDDPERIRLISRISQVVTDAPELLSAFHTIWACLWLADVSKLQELVALDRTDMVKRLEGDEIIRIVQKCQ